MAPAEKRAAAIAMTYLLDDPAPQVRVALSRALAPSADAPHSIVLALAEDQLEIAAPVILSSPVLSAADLVDLAAGGSAHTRALIASRPSLDIRVVAALAEVAGVEELLILLENPTARFGRVALRRMAERHGADASLRECLLNREDLPVDARHVLVEHVSDAVSGLLLVTAAMGRMRAEKIAGEAKVSAALELAGQGDAQECDALVEQMRARGELTPAFLMQVLCAGRTDFFAGALSALTQMEERRVRSILATGRYHSVRALIESAGLSRSVSSLFVDAILLWRQTLEQAPHVAVCDVLEKLVERSGKVGETDGDAAELLEIVVKFQRLEERRRARDFASALSLAAA
ncbi:uncharacterized protein (DUF2336 family) [Rhizobium halophytocola]|uniref:Uncharacterized protein (DUF2336 family) n=2 Tax=Rhizobium halophytocola TaxID=735519 RepID=A0ABS4DWC5_9HYPH|nr:DUF2336 domain-containing protein [Rhizobium halophytocola]MBP1849982.1 uncharacterized protein (DUF2336 family) [Rhizobium halophytocola]